MLDNETGLYYYGARWYDPVIGRFITPDTIVQDPYDPQTLNRYAYVRNNPLKYVDPNGHVFFLLPVLQTAMQAYAAMSMMAGIGNTMMGIMSGDPDMLFSGISSLATSYIMGNLATGMGGSLEGAIGYSAIAGFMSMTGAEQGREGEAFLTGFGMSMTVYGINYLAGGGGSIGNAALENTETKACDSLTINKSEEIASPTEDNILVITSKWGKRVYNGQEEFHSAIDIRSGKAYATEGGKVIKVGPDITGANRIVIQGNISGQVQGYYHVKSNLKVGGMVTKGMFLGNTDLSGRSSGRHIHFVTSINGTIAGRYNPVKYFNEYSTKIRIKYK